MVHSIDASGVIVDVSQRWLEVLGYSRSEAIGRKSTDFLTEESRAYATENVLPEFFRSGRCVDAPYQIVARNGDVLDVLLSATCVRGDDGQVLRSIAVMQDVTARKRAERKLDAAKAYAENLLYSANVLVVELDNRGRVGRLNRAVENMTGFNSTDLAGKDWFETVSLPVYAAGIRARLNDLLSSGDGDRFESVVVTKSGTERRVVWRNSPAVEDGRVVGMLCVGVDVTEQRKAESRLASSEKALREAQNVAQIGSWTLDHRSGELHWSEEMFHILGLDPQTAVASEDVFLNALHPEDRGDVAKAYLQALERHRPYDLRHRLLLADGTVKYVHQRSEVSYSESGQPERSVGTVQDVTMPVLQEMALQESEQMFRTIADFTYDWEYWQGRQLEMLYISPSCKRLPAIRKATSFVTPI